MTKGSAPAWSNAVDPATNRLVGQPYDAVGNQGWEEYDSWNRLAPIEYYTQRPQYVYDASNKRVARLLGSPPTEEEIIFYGIDGRKLETYRRPTSSNYADPYTLDAYFAGTLIISESRRVIADRLGSVRGDTTGQRYNYYPYGEERGGTANDVTKFGTYFRESSGIDYADQRYYANNQGRFLTPDPSGSSASAANPGSWNRYEYVQGDPVNNYDPEGLLAVKPCGGLDKNCGPQMGVNTTGGGHGGAGGVGNSNAKRRRVERPESKGKHGYAGGGQTPDSRVVSRLWDIRENIDSDYLNWLESGIAGGSTEVFDSYFGVLVGANATTPLAGAADFRGTKHEKLNAVKGPMGSGYYITVNTSGAFFTSNAGVGYGGRHDSEISAIGPNTDVAQRFILLHELAHYFEAQDFNSNDRGREASAANNDLLWDKCAKTIQGPMI